MAGTILTPTALWKNFTTSQEFNVQEVSTSERDGFLSTNFYLEGRVVKGEAVKIYCEMTSDAKVKRGPSIIMLQEFESQTDYRLITDLVNQGYSVIIVDLAGKKEHKEHFTEYPEAISYANYEQSKDNLLLVKQDVTDTCWYEWTAVVRQVLAYLKSLPSVSKVGGIGIGKASTIMWQVAGTDDKLDSAVMVFNAGWMGYQGINKFSGEKEPQFGDNMYKFIAGVDAQSYAMHVKCPTMVLSATNSNVFDVDRVADTLSFIKEEVYSAVHYSVGKIDEIDCSGYKNLKIFLEKTLVGANKLKFRTDIDLSASAEDGKVYFEVTAQKTAIKEVALYVAEQQVKPQNRSWQKLSPIKTIGARSLFEYTPYPTCGLITFFAVVTYQDGFSVGSKVESLRVEDKALKPAFKSKVLYSSRNDNAESAFFCSSKEKSPSQIMLGDCSSVSVKRGPMGILGITGESKLTTFKVATTKYKMEEGSIIMFDAFSPEKNQITVTLTCDYFGQKREYSACVALFGGQVWKNVQLEMSKFKTEEGMALKSYEKVEAISFSVDEGEYLINNLLWV